MSPQHRFKLVMSSALSLLLLTSCEALRPADVCAADETLTTATYIIQQTLLPQGEPSLVKQAFEELFQVEMITFEGYDRQTRRVSCSAHLGHPNGKPIPFTYTRIPEVGADGYVYSAQIGGGPQGAFSLGYRLGQRYRELEAQALAPQQPDAPPQNPEAFVVSPRAPEVKNFPLGHDSAEANIDTLEKIDTAAALMTGQMTREAAHLFCANSTSPSNDIQVCIRQQIESNPGKLIASANCHTREILTSSGLPFRRVQGGWRNENTKTVVNDNAPPESGIGIIQTQFATLCPTTAARTLP